MILELLDWIIIVSFLILFVWIGVSFRKTASKSLENFFLGGRNLPWYVAGTSMVATTFAADTPLAVSEIVQKNGVAGNWIWWCFLTGGILTTFFFSRYWRRANILTELELIDIRYSGPEAKFLRLFKAIYLGLFMNILIIGWVNLAFISIIQVFFGIDFSTAMYITFGVMTLAVVYSSASGLLGVAITDMVQFAVAMVGCIILAVLVLNSDEVGGMANLKQNLAPEYFNFFPSFDSGNTVATLGLSIGAFFSFFAVQWWASWYPGSEPGGGGYIAQRMMSTRTGKDSLYATLFFQIAHYCIRPWPWIIVALCAVYLYGNNGVMDPESMSQFSESSRLGFVFTMRDFLPVGLKGLLLVAFISAYLSTISTQLNWGASFIVNDFIKPLKLTKEESLVKSGRWVTLILMLFGVAITNFITSISGVWEFIIECGAGLGLVLILRWYWWRINAWSEITAIIAPFVGFTIGKLFLEPSLDESFLINKGTYLFTVGFSTISWILVTYLTKSTETVVLRSFYKRVKPLGNWKRFSGNTSNKPLLNLIGAWISALGLVYSALFFIGYLLFLEYTLAVIWLSVGITSSLIFYQRLKSIDFTKN